MEEASTCDMLRLSREFFNNTDVTLFYISAFYENDEFAERGSVQAWRRFDHAMYCAAESKYWIPGANAGPADVFVDSWCVTCPYRSSEGDDAQK